VVPVDDGWTKNMGVIPVNFGKEHKAMLGHAKMILEDEGRRIAINPVFDKLLLHCVLLWMQMEH
jgi:hypothetical protein